MESDPKIPPKPNVSANFTPLSHWLGNPSEKKMLPKKAEANLKEETSKREDSDCRSTIEVERVGQTISRIHITCSCGDRHSVELHQLPVEDAEVSSPSPGEEAK